MNFKTLVPALLVAATATGFGVMSATSTAHATTSQTTVSVAGIGKAAPTFTLMDTDGKKISLADFKGKTVVLEWFCPTCPYSGGQGLADPRQRQGRRADDRDEEGGSGAVYLPIDSSTKKMRTTVEELTKRDAAIKKKLGIKSPS